MYSRLQIYGDCDVDFLWSVEGEVSETDKSKVTGSGITDMTWTGNTVALSNFDGSTDGNSAIGSLEIYKYVIQRREVGTDTVVDVAVTDKVVIRDYNCQSTKSYEYIVTPVYLDKNGNDCFADRSVTDVVTLNSCGVTIMDILPTFEENVYKADDSSVWNFGANVEKISYTTSNDVSYINTYARFPREHRGKTNYLSASFSALIGNITCGDYEGDNIDKIERFRDFCTNGNLKLFKDTKGNILPCSIKDRTDTSNNVTLQQETTITFDVVQLADYKTISVYSEGVL